MRRFALFALAAFGFSIPLANGFVISGLGTLSTATGVVALVLTLGAVLHARRVRAWGPPMWLVAASVAWAATTYFWSVDRALTWTRIVTLVQAAGAFWVIWELSIDERSEAVALQGFVLGAGLLAAAVLRNFLADPAALARGLVRVTALGANPNGLALLLALAVPPAWYLSLRTESPVGAWGNRALIVLMTLAVGLTASRGGAVALCVALLIVPLTGRRLSVPARGFLLMAITGLGVLLAAALPHSSLERLRTTPAAVEVGTMTHRTVIWRQGVRQLQSTWLEGVGAGAFERIATLRSRPTVAHDTYLSVLVEQGVVGFMVFAALLVSVLVGAARAGPGEGRWFALVLFATLLVGMIPLSWEHRASMWFVLGIVGARWGRRRWPA